MHVSIVGPGRLGRTLAALLSPAHRVELVDRGGRAQAPNVVLAVPDSAIADAAQTVPEGAVVLHCSGTTPFGVLRPHRPAGSFHPLMTFPGPEVGIPELTGVPAAIAGDPEALALGRALAAALGMRAIEVPGDRRLYHAAAVIAGNFATVLLAEASRVLAAAGVPESEAPGLLAPLARQSIENAGRVGPAHSLTGPVARGDEATLAGHREALRDAGLEELLPLYDELTQRARRLVDEKAVVGAVVGAKV
ncbi:MAG: DUF2520 domain-containing protein [Myxococcota bacterium]